MISVQDSREGSRSTVVLPATKSTVKAGSSEDISGGSPSFGGMVPESLSAEAIAAFCHANPVCRDFLKGVSSCSSADLILVRASSTDDIV